MVYFQINFFLRFLPNNLKFPFHSQVLNVFGFYFFSWIAKSKTSILPFPSFLPFLYFPVLPFILLSFFSLASLNLVLSLSLSFSFVVIHLPNFSNFHYWKLFSHFRFLLHVSLPRMFGFSSLLSCPLW